MFPAVNETQALAFIATSLIGQDETGKLDLRQRMARLFHARQRAVTRDQMSELVQQPKAR
ncbi:MAG: hypothetical protein HY866_10315 [Chloroflexi bacterium]|nr:hypothetical protein [Chloroflexota bacterium]